MKRIVFLVGVLATFACVPVRSQYARIEVEKEPGPKIRPAGEPLPRWRIDMPPEEIFAKLVSRDAGQIRNALAALGSDWMSDSQPSDVRLFAVQMESSRAQLDRVLMVSSMGHEMTVVLRQEGREWWSIGVFYCCGPRAITSDKAEIRSTVWYGTHDLIVPVFIMSGTGIGRRDIAIYRVWNGGLYKVFETIKTAHNWQEEESTELAYPDMESSTAEKIILVRKTRIQNVRTAKERRTVTCVPYRWDSARFEFIATRPPNSPCPPPRN